MINSFGIAIPPKIDESDEQLNQPTAGVLTVDSVLSASVPAISHNNQDVKNAAIKIVLDVQRLTGSVKEGHFEKLPERTKEMILEKVFSVQCETEFNQTKKKDLSASKRGLDALGQMQEAAKELNIVTIGDFNTGAKESQAKQMETFEKNKRIIEEKGTHKDWQQKELALQAMQEIYEMVSFSVLKEQADFIGECVKIIKQCLDENNIQIYLVAIQVASVFLAKTLNVEVVTESLPSLLKSVVLRTTDTNTRVRKKSIDLVFQIWDHNTNKAGATGSIQPSGTKLENEHSISVTIANVLCEPSLHDKAIVGRLSLFIKKAMMVESGEDLNKKAHKMILGRDYE